MSGGATELYLVRHGEALPADGGTGGDADRVLSGRGEEEASAAGRILAAMEPRISLILTSPLVRARATGSLMASQFAVRPAVKETEALLPGFRRKALLEELRRCGPSARVAAVGHQPDLGQFLSALISGTDHAGVAFPPGTIAAVSLFGDAGGTNAHLRWLLPPALATTLSGSTTGEGNR